MAMYRTKSGRNKVVFLSNEIISALSKFAQETEKSESWIVREALIRFLRDAGGMSFSENANPEGRGVRTDLKLLNRTEAEEYVKHLKKTRKHKNNEETPSDSK